ncbi:MAG: tetratricopeptide repeat protein [Pseudomonadota bacterium]
MPPFLRHLKPVVAALAFVLAGAAGQAQGVDMEALYRRLADPDNADWALAQSDILREWSKSGSPSMDLLLKRGRDAIEAGDLAAAIEHLTALTDQAPDFAEGWNARATAYFMAGEVGPSIADIQRALALNPRHFGALSGLGQIFEALDKPDLALRAYEAAFAVNPHMTSVKDAIDRLTREKQGTDL